MTAEYRVFIKFCRFCYLSLEQDLAVVPAKVWDHLSVLQHAILI